MQRLEVFPNGYNYRRKITLNQEKIAGALSNFVMLFTIVDPNLRSVSNGGSVKSASGYDLRFETITGTKLNHELMSYDATTGEVFAWVNIPTITNSTDEIYLYFGKTLGASEQNIALTWADYKNVYHLNGDGTDALGLVNGTVSNVSWSTATKKIKQSASFNGSTSYIDIDNLNNYPDDFAVSLWCRNNALVGSDASARVFGAGYTGVATNYGFTLLSSGVSESTSYLYNVRDTTGNVESIGITLPKDTWKHIVMIKHGTALRIYVDGVSVGTATLDASTIKRSVVTSIGANAGTSANFNGFIEQVSIKNTSKTASDVLTEFNNQNSPATFYYLSEIETADGVFLRYATSDIRPIRTDVFIAFPKVYNAGIGGDQDWDNYEYTDYTNRLISVEWEREQPEFASVPMAVADIVLDNHDDFFTESGTSPIAQYILPARPIKIYAGFNDLTMQCFVGITDGMPVYNHQKKTVTFHAVDFFSTLLKRTLDESFIFENQRTDQIIETLFNDFGITSDKLDLSVGLNVPKFVYFKKGTILREALFKLMEAENGRVFMTEDGTITFRNRQDYSVSSVFDLNTYKNIVSSIPKTPSELINVVQIKANIREVQQLQLYGQLTSAVRVPANSMVNVWIDLPNPVTSAVTPDYILDATTSFFDTNTLEDGTGNRDSGVVLDSATLFDTSMKLVFQNATAYDLFVTAIDIYATPAIVAQEVYVREEDSTSVSKYGENILDIESDFFATVGDVESKALIILHTFADVGSTKSLSIKGSFALQLDDPIQVNLYGITTMHRIIKITNKVSDGGFTQILTLGKLIDNTNYFTLGISAIGGDDMIAP